MLGFLPHRVETGLSKQGQSGSLISFHGICLSLVQHDELTFEEGDTLYIIEKVGCEAVG